MGHANHHFHIGRRADVDMTQGSILRHIIAFAFPLLLGNLFQQLYNTVDTWVVGNYVDNEAFTAVGAVGPIINMLIGAFMGLSSGAGVVISQYYGANRHDKVEETVHTAATMTLILGVLFTIIGILITPVMLDFADLHEGSVDEATAYLTIYFSGMIGLFVYNMGASILRAVGDSRRPFYYLVVCAILNTVLDLMFVLAFGMGVEGVALATIISQGVSAVLVVIALLRADNCIRLIPRKLKIHWELFEKILSVGIPAAVQMAITAFSNVFVQSYVNHFDAGMPSSNYMAGWTAYGKIDQLLFLPIQSVALATTTFVGQNLGKNQVKRAKKGVLLSFLLSAGCTIVLMIPVMYFAPQIVSFLNSKTEVVTNGTLFLRLLSPFFVVNCYYQIYIAALRGAGNGRAPMIMMLTSFVAIRQIYLFIVSQVCYEIIPVAMSFSVGWAACTVMTAIYYHVVPLEKHRLVDDTKAE